MIEHVYRRAAAASSVDEVIVATDDLRIATRVNEFGGRVRLTKATHRSGTDRLAEIVAGMDSTSSSTCRATSRSSTRAPSTRSSRRSGRPVDSDDDAVPAHHAARRSSTTNVVKVVVDRGGFALYFSRAPIPHMRDPRGGWPPLYRHIGLYAYRRNALLVLASLEPTPLERAESLEQLRALEHGIRIKAVETAYDSIERGYARGPGTCAPPARGADFW